MLLPSSAKRMLPVLGLLTILSACSGATGGSVTTDTICRELRRDLPTYSTRDTAETLQSGARFVTVFQAICQE